MTSPPHVRARAPSEAWAGPSLGARARTCGKFEANRVQPLRIDDPCILFALERERGPFCREFRPNQAFDGAPCWAHFCGPAWLSVLVVETGVGPANVARVLDWLLAAPKFGAVPYEPS